MIPDPSALVEDSGAEVDDIVGRRKAAAAEAVATKFVSQTIEGQGAGVYCTAPSFRDFLGQFCFQILR